MRLHRTEDSRWGESTTDRRHVLKLKKVQEALGEEYLQLCSAHTTAQQHNCHWASASGSWLTGEAGGFSEDDEGVSPQIWGTSKRNATAWRKKNLALRGCGKGLPINRKSEHYQFQQPEWECHMFTQEERSWSSYNYSANQTTSTGGEEVQEGPLKKIKISFLVAQGTWKQ